MRSFPNQIGEFLAASRKAASYDLRHNLYVWFGILWGLPIPLVTITMHLHVLGAAGSDTGLTQVLASPLQWFFLAHPPLFGILFGILGTIRNDKETEIEKMVARLEQQSIHDPLTGLKNRRYFAHIFHDECARSLRRREPLTLLFLDLDHFKRVNDDYGHHFGDRALQETARYFTIQCRPYDTIVRWGGEEFVILLRATDETAAFTFAERIRAGLAAALLADLPFRLTISVGLAQYQDNDTLEMLVDRADQAMYQAKQSGRNRVVAWSSLPAAAAQRG
jgi:diguanylate cyclase (GGDEF)-like protein